MRMPTPGTGDRGTTLVELLMAVSILGVGITAVMGGMMTSVTVSDRARQQAEATALTRSYAEALAAAPYAACATSYAATGFAPPAGFTATLVADYWAPATATFTATGAGCPGTDSGLQRLTLTVASNDGRATAVLRTAKRAKPAGETP